MGLVLIVEIAVEGVKPAFADAPRHASGRPPFLAVEAEAQRLIPHGALVSRQQQPGHEILEHGACPGHRPHIAGGFGKHPAQRTPVLLAHPAGGNGKIPGHPALAHQQIVIGRAGFPGIGI